MPYWTLVNPMIIGKMHTTVKCKKASDAAEKIYSELSDGFDATKYNPILFITLQQRTSKGDQIGGANAIYKSFKITERVSGGNAKWNIYSYDNKIDSNKLNNMITKVKSRGTDSEVMVMTGGGNTKKDTFLDDLLYYSDGGTISSYNSSSSISDTELANRVDNGSSTELVNKMTGGAKKKKFQTRKLKKNKVGGGDSELYKSMLDDLSDDDDDDDDDDIFKKNKKKKLRGPDDNEPLQVINYLVDPILDYYIYTPVIYKAEILPLPIWKNPFVRNIIFMGV